MASEILRSFGLLAFVLGCLFYGLLGAGILFVAVVQRGGPSPPARPESLERG